MFTITRTAGRIAVAAVIAVAGGFAASGASAAGANTMVAVPTHPSINVPVRVPQSWADGCYRLTTSIYGPYKVNFCIDGAWGTYHVSGGGLDCRGNVRSDTDGIRVDIALSASRCGRGVMWSADTMSCVARPVAYGGYGGGYGDGYGNGYRDGASAAPDGRPTPFVAPNVAVPVYPNPGPKRADLLNCTYQPGAWGYPDTSVTARRTS